jgi:hypothetical protein
MWDREWVRRLVDLQRHTGAAPATEVIGMRKPTVSSSESDDKLVVGSGAVQLRCLSFGCHLAETLFWWSSCCDAWRVPQRRSSLREFFLLKLMRSLQIF